MVEQSPEANSGKHRRLRLIPGFRTDQDPEEYDPNVLHRVPKEWVPPHPDPNVITMPLMRTAITWLKGGPSISQTDAEHNALVNDFLVENRMHLDLVPPNDLPIEELLAGSSIGTSAEPYGPAEGIEIIDRSGARIVVPPDDVL